jgi:hypothetical protein
MPSHILNNIKKEGMTILKNREMALRGLWGEKTLSKLSCVVVVMPLPGRWCLQCPGFDITIAGRTIMGANAVP